MEPWQKVVLAAGGAVAASAVVCYLLQGEEEGAKQGHDGREERESKVSKFDDITKEQVEQILKEIYSSQEEMKGHMEELTKELLQSSFTFEQTYQKVKAIQPEDPLENHHLTMMDFDRLLDKFQRDPNVKKAIAQIMGAPNPSNVTSEKVKNISVKNIIDVHTFMLEELEKLVKYFEGLRDQSSYEMKTVTIASQAIVSAKTEEKFGITSKEIECAVLMHHTVLATDQVFAGVNVEIQTAMGKLMGSSFQ